MDATQQGVRRLTNLTTGGPVHVDVEDGRIRRIVPLQLDESDAPSWTIAARGRSFTPPRKTTLSPWTVAHRSTIYAPNRILTPLKRVDFDPHGARNIDKRGESAYEPIGWDEALDMVAAEMIRIKREVRAGRPCVTTAGSHHLWGNVGYRFSAYNRFMNLVGFTYAEHNPDSWEGWQWGGAHMWGFAHRLGIPEQYDLLEDALEHTEMMVFWSADPETTGGVYGSFESTSRRFWLKELGVKMVFIDPYHNPTAQLFGDKWLAPRPGTDVALAPGDRAHLARRGHLRQGVRRRAHARLRRVAGLRARQERQRAQDAGVGGDRVRRAGPADPRPRPRVGPQQDDARGRRHGRLGRRLPRLQRQRVVAGHDRPGRHAGHGQAGQQHLVHHERRAVRPGVLLPRLRRGRHLRRRRRHGRRQEARQPHVAGRRHLQQPAALARGPDGPAPAHPRGDEPRAPRVARQGLLRLVHRVASSASTTTRPRATRTCRCTTATAARSSAR